MKLMCAAVGAAALLAAGASAQTMQTTQKSKVEVKGGKDVTVAGCLERDADGAYLLTSPADGDMKYELVTSDDLGKHVGHLVQVKGRATDKGDAKVKVEDKVKTDREHGDDHERKMTSEMKGDLPGMHYLGVKSVKTIADSCR